MLKEKNKKRKLIALGVIMCVLGVSMLSSNYINEKVDKAYNVMNLQLLAMNDIDLKELDENEEVEENKETSSPSVEVNNTNNEQNNTKPSTIQNNTQNNTQTEDKYAKYYIAKLSIPKIKLEKGLVGIDSPYNTVSKNIQIIKGSDYPDVTNGNLILASHAGTNSVSYFRNLYKLVKGDKCTVTYNGKTYTYQIVDIYTKPKTGQIAIYRNYEKNTLTLITCTRGSDTKQTVYIAELINIK